LSSVTEAVLNEKKGEGGDKRSGSLNSLNRWRGSDKKVPIAQKKYHDLRLGSIGFFLATQSPILTLLRECSNGGKIEFGG
jgi:hypothetical protein